MRLRGLPPHNLSRRRALWKKTTTASRTATACPRCSAWTKKRPAQACRPRFIGMSDTSVTKVSSEQSPAGELGQKYLASGVHLAMRLWKDEPPAEPRPEASAGI